MIIERSSNFREISIGEIAPGVLYRSNHPISNNRQVKEIALAANKAKIKTVINLCDSTSSLQSIIILCPWYKKLLDENNVIAVNMSMQYDITNRRFHRQMNDAITFMAEHEPPYLIHCLAGADRTGILCILLESFMGANWDEIVMDYMLTFVDKSEYSKNDHKNGLIFMFDLFSKIKGASVTSNDNPKSLILRYLNEKVKVNDEVLSVLKSKLSNTGE